MVIYSRVSLKKWSFFLWYTHEQKRMSLASWGMSPLTSSIVVESCPSPRWWSAEELFSKSGAENRGDFRSQELTSVLCCAFWAQVNMEKTHNIWIQMADLVVMISPSLHHSQSSNTMIDHYLAWTLVAAKRETQAATLTPGTNWFCPRTKVWHNRIIFSKHQWTLKNVSHCTRLLSAPLLSSSKGSTKKMFFRNIS